MINKGLFCIISSQILEHLGYYSLFGNIIYLLNSSDLCWSYSNTLICGFMLSGFTYVGCLMGGLLADIFIKKTTVVIIGYMLYSQYATFTIAFYPNDINATMTNCSNFKDVPLMDEYKFKFIMPGVLCVALGAGFIKSVIASIGTDIVTKHRLTPSVFYNFYYWGLNLGSLLAYLIFALIQQTFSKFYGLVIPAALVVVSFFIFLIGYPCYVKLVKPEKSTPNLLLSVIKEGIVRWFKKPTITSNSESKKQNYHNTNTSFTKRQIDTKSTLGILYEDTNQEIEVRLSEDDVLSRSDIMIFTDDDDESEIDPAFLTVLAARSGNAINENNDNNIFPNVAEVQDTKITSKNHSNNNEIVVQSTTATSPEPRNQQPNFLDRAKIRFGGVYSEEDVENVRKILNVGLLMICLIPYWIAYFQMSTTFFNQGIHMNLRVTNNFLLPVAYLTTMDIILVMVAIPVAVHFIYPYMTKHNWKPRFHWRIIFGMLLAALSLVIAAVVEGRRVNASKINQTIFYEQYTARDLTIFVQIPQYIVMGLSEVMTVVSGLEMACTMVPKSMQGLSNSVFFFVSGFSSFLAGGLVQLFQWIYKKENASVTDSFMPHMDLYFFIIAILPFIGAFVFMIVYSRLSIQKEKSELEFSMPYSSFQNFPSDEQQATSIPSTSNAA